ncbi:hypothetical protein HanRHA438_Chr03g0107331 [Helianthus annuus]|nr:hypothetical protein HanIR_Chr03g0105061 [Helianthus annuus]KAJ0934431.1 hypothetical protein HanRHA438_Chr03g0107331 [Helianthus annuus]
MKHLILPLPPLALTKQSALLLNTEHASFSSTAANISSSPLLFAALHHSAALYVTTLHHCAANISSSFVLFRSPPRRSSPPRQQVRKHELLYVYMNRLYICSDLYERSFMICCVYI